MSLSTAKPEKQTALHHRHLAANAVMADADGWRCPERYREVAEETTAARERVGLADISPNGKLDLKGSAAVSFAGGALRWKSPGGGGLPPGEGAAVLSVPGSAPIGTGQGVGTPPDGSPAPLETPSVNTALGELPTANSVIPVRCCRLAHDHLLLLTPPEDAATARETLTEAVASVERTHVTDVTSVLAGIALVGPRARDVLRKLTALDIRPTALDDGACAETALAGVHALLLRADLGSLPAYEIYVTRDVAEFVWDTLCDAGREYGMLLIGRLAHRSLRDVNV